MVIVWGLWVPLASPVVWDLRGALDVPFLVIRIVALAGLIWVVRSFDLPDFFGDHPPGTPAAGTVRLSTGGAFALCRHPLYLFMSLLAAAETYLPLGRALMAAALVIYVPIGSRLEEIKLEQEFGADYTRYRARTPVADSDAGIDRARLAAPGQPRRLSRNLSSGATCSDWISSPPSIIASISRAGTRCRRRSSLAPGSAAVIGTTPSARNV